MFKCKHVGCNVSEYKTPRKLKKEKEVKELLKTIVIGGITALITKYIENRINSRKNW